MSSINTDKKIPFSRSTNKHSRLETFSQQCCNSIFSNCLSHNSPAKGWPNRFRSRGTTGSSTLDHDLGHFCRGRRTQTSGHSDYVRELESSRDSFPFLAQCTSSVRSSRKWKKCGRKCKRWTVIGKMRKMKRTEDSRSKRYANHAFMEWRAQHPWCVEVGLVKRVHTILAECAAGCLRASSAGRNGRSATGGAWGKRGDQSRRRVAHFMSASGWDDKWTQDSRLEPCGACAMYDDALTQEKQDKTHSKSSLVSISSSCNVTTQA